MNTSTADKGITGAMPTWLRAILVGGLIYAFLVGVSALEAGVKFMGQDTQERLFENVSNPLAGLCIGILGTVLVQSSSASTSVIVGLVAAGAIDIDTAVPMIMGANIGTTVTNTLVALGSARQSNEFRRAFAAATVHDFFNVIAVAILLPLELATGVISSIAGWLSDLLVGSSGSDWKSPIKQWVKTPVGWIKDFWSWIGLSGNTLGVVMIITGLAIVLISLALITKNMRQLIADRVERSMNSVLAKGNGSIAMLLGMVITMLVQSSSITTSILIPMSAAGVITLRNAYPVTLGANVGTTITALLAALATGSTPALTVALTHTVFNVTGILILYVPPFVRDVPVYCAEWLARIAASRPVWAVGYVMGAFIVLPLIGVIVAR
ncbi:MAG: Na/Pi symporter [Actinobacteria bacterium]|nr:Na/Pi symporter [Actinomycetota bacterium]